MTLFMFIFMTILTAGCIYNTVVAYRAARDEALAWTTAAFFAFSLSLNYLSAFLKSAT